MRLLFNASMTSCFARADAVNVPTPMTPCVTSSGNPLVDLGFMLVGGGCWRGRKPRQKIRQFPCWRRCAPHKDTLRCCAALDRVHWHLFQEMWKQLQDEAWLHFRCRGCTTSAA